MTFIGILYLAIAYVLARVVGGNPTVAIASGTVAGTATRVLNQPSSTGLVNAYLGVPFAKSPPLRFAPPLPPAPWNGTLLAQRVAPACIQQFMGSTGPRVKFLFDNPGYLGVPSESEDCLYLNIFAPQNASPSDRKAVLFWLYGGAYAFGTGSLPLYNGSSLAVNQDVVVVTCNFRTNIFGFPSSPEIPSGSRNVGLLDQRLALSWVTENIAAFGGDPSRITLFGQSSGSDSVMQLLAQPPSPLPFHGAIIESAGVLSTMDSQPNYNQTVQHFNCSSNKSPIECLRKVSATDIQAYINTQSLSFLPALNDGTYTTNVRPSIDQKVFANVPVLMGTTAQEAAIYLAIYGIDSSSVELDQVLGNLNLTMATVLQNYPRYITNDPYTTASRVLTDAAFTCPTASLAFYLSVHSYSVWRYLYSASFPNIPRIKCPNDGCAYHSSELYEVFGTYPLQSFFGLGPATATQMKLSSYMQGLWAGWAKSPLKGPGWPKIGSNLGIELGVLGGSNNATGEYTDLLLSRDAPCPMFGPAGDGIEIFGDLLP